MPGKIYVGNTGVTILVDMQSDITTASGQVFYVKKPSGEQVTWTPDIYSTKYLKYITQVNDLDEQGTYNLQPYFVLNTWSGYGETVTFKVFKQDN